MDKTVNHVMTTNSGVAQKFVEMINAHDVEGLTELMTADHTFIDSLGNRLTRPAVEAGWSEYFSMIPDYWVKTDRMVTDENAVILFGSAGGTYVPKGATRKPGNRWETPAVWRAVIRGQKVSEWRIYADNEPIRERMRAKSS